MSTGTADFYLLLPDEFDYQKNIDYLLRDTKEIMYQIEGEKIVFARSCVNRIIVCSISQEGTKLAVTIKNNLVLTKEEKQILEKYIIEFFDLNRSLSDFYQMAATDDILQGLEVRYRGLRLMGVPDFFEAMTWGILGQQINLSFAYTVKRNLVEAYGNSVKIEGKTYWTFPKPEEILNASVEDLRGLQISQRKIEYLQEIARMIVEDGLSKEYYLQFETVEKIEKEMTKIRGVGPWTANYVMMRCLRMTNAFPKADIGLLNALKHVMKLEQKPDKVMLDQLEEKWQPWCAYATFYLWRVLY